MDLFSDPLAMLTKYKLNLAQEDGICKMFLPVKSKSSWIMYEGRDSDLNEAIRKCVEEIERKAA